MKIIVNDTLLEVAESVGSGLIAAGKAVKAPEPAAKSAARKTVKK